MDLQTIWFILLFVLLGGYAILDGFDLGVGMLHLSAKGDSERRLHLQAIAPVWDGNEVWLITGGGALFAAFPFVYATVFSALYLPLYLVLVALIGRACAIEFRSKEESLTWRRIWDGIFFLSSLLPSILFGVAFGNILRGLPIEMVEGHRRFTGDFLGLLNPYSIMIGVLSMLLFLLQGAFYLAGKSQGPQQERMRKLIPILWLLAVLLYTVASTITLITLPHLFDATGTPLFWVFLLLIAVSATAVPICAYARWFGRGLIASSTMLGSMMFLAALNLFPRLVPSLLHPKDLDLSLTISNASSTPYTLKIMLGIALVGMPIVLFYTFWIYRVFRGKQVIDPHGY
jgi:cytochrome bd ubiquinol oxidase subunit II